MFHAHQIIGGLLDSAAWGFIGSILGAVVGASTSIATSAISARHSLNLSIANKNFDCMERFNAFQRENLLAVQDLIQEIMRYMARIHMASRDAHRNGRTWGRGLPNPEVEQSLRLSNQKFSALVERISNDALRAGLEESTVKLRWSILPTLKTSGVHIS